jgi:hypothetical protein
MRHNHIHEIAVVNNSGVIGVIAFTVPVTLLRIAPSCRTNTMPPPYFAAEATRDELGNVCNV